MLATHCHNGSCRYIRARSPLIRPWNRGQKSADLAQNTKFNYQTFEDHFSPLGHICSFFWISKSCCWSNTPNPTPNIRASFLGMIFLYFILFGKIFLSILCGTPQVLKLFSANPSMKVNSYTRYHFDRVMLTRVRPRFFDQVGHQTTNASIGNKYFFTK